MVYLRKGCHLCDDMLEGLDSYSDEYGYDYITTDIDTNPTLLAKYNEAVPVVELNGQELFRYFFEPETLRLHLTKV